MTVCSALYVLPKVLTLPLCAKYRLHGVKSIFKSAAVVANLQPESQHRDLMVCEVLSSFSLSQDSFPGTDSCLPASVSWLTAGRVTQCSSCLNTLEPGAAKTTITREHWQKSNYGFVCLLSETILLGVEAVFPAVWEHEWQLMVSPKGREMSPDIFIYADCVQIPAGRMKKEWGA